MSQPRLIHPIPPILIFFISGLLLLCITTLIASQLTYSPQEGTAATSDLGTIRKLLSEHQQEVGDEDEDEDALPMTTSLKSPKKKPTTIPSFHMNQTKSNVVNPSSNFSSKNLTKAFSSSKNSTKPIKPKLGGLGGKNSSKLAKIGGGDSGITKVELKKLNSTATKLAKKLNSTGKASDLVKPGKDFAKKSMDLATVKKPTLEKAVKKPTLEKAAKKAQGKESKGLEGEKKSEGSSKADPVKKKVPKKETPSLLDLYGSGIEDTGDENDLVAQFRDLPAEFHRSLLPDLEKISAASKDYVGKANERIAKNFRPYVGRRYASTAAAVASFAFALVPLIVVSLVVRHMKEHLSVQRTAMFVHVYLAVYFSILCISALLTGVEPLRFFDATAHSTYAFLQIVQMVGYTLYLMLFFLYLVRVFMTGSGPGSKLLVLAQVAVSYAVGIHYYVMVFHRAVSHQPPKTSWKIHGFYAACFMVVCILARAAEHRKKAYLEGGGGREGDKQS